MTGKKSKAIKTKEVHLNKEAIKHLVKVVDTPKAWALYDRLWDLSAEAVALQHHNADACTAEA